MKLKKFIKKSVNILLVTAILIGSVVWEGDILGQSAAVPTTVSAKYSLEVQGVWIAFLDYKDAGLYNKGKKKFKANAEAYFKKLKKDGINTIYFHVVPCNDAIYPSKYLSWSSYMFKSEPNYDPLEILVEASHKYKISFHAWINPYRKTMQTIYDPGKASSMNRVVKIVKEIIQNYDVDGIHFDDYFYQPSSKVSVAKKKTVINKMVRKVYKTVKDYDEDMLFGISPAGIVSYAESIGCDLKTWLSKKGYVDYIVPQIYWTDQYVEKGKVTKLFTERLNQWIKLDKNDTPMYIGLGLYRGGTYNASDRGWSRKNNNIVTQIKQLKREGCEGFVFFRSGSLYAGNTKKEVKNYRNYIHSK